MRSKYLWLVPCITSCCLLVPPAVAIVYQVPGSYSTIQAGINACTPGDTVLVDPGTYPEWIDLAGKAILVGSWYILTGDTAHVRQTVIQPPAGVLTSVVSFINGETRSTRLSGFTITGGNVDNGGGIRCVGASPVLDHLRIVDNVALNDGGGIHAFEGLPLVTACWISGNTATSGDGGGIWSQYSGIFIEDNEIHGNHAWFRGAGIFCEYATPTINDNIVTGNIIDRPPGMYRYGGGIVSRVCVSVIIGNYVAGNDGGGFGGGIFY
ncbi:MAG: right-handed parallel beta-helix repeat-containing protein [bacterium]